MSGQDDRIWALHCKGFSPSQIAANLNVSAAKARAVVCRMWKMDRRTSR